MVRPNRHPWAVVNPELIEIDQLRSWLKLERRGAIIRWLEQNGIRWRPAANGDPVTTTSAINAVFVRGDGPDDIDPDEFF